MVLNNGFCEMSQDEIMLLEGEVFGDISVMLVLLFVVLWHVWQQEDGQQLLRVLPQDGIGMMQPVN